MKGSRIRARRLVEIFADTIEDGMGGFMNDNVVRKTCENDLSRQVDSDILTRRAEVAKKKCAQIRIVEGVSFLHCMRENLQSPMVWIFAGSAIRPPLNFTAESHFKPL